MSLGDCPQNQPISRSRNVNGEPAGRQPMRHERASLCATAHRATGWRSATDRPAARYTGETVRKQPDNQSSRRRKIPGDQEARALEHQSRSVTIAGRGHRARSAVRRGGPARLDRLRFPTEWEFCVRYRVVSCCRPAIWSSSRPAWHLTAAGEQPTAGRSYPLRPSWRIRVMLSSTPNAPASFPPATWKM